MVPIAEQSHPPQGPNEKRTNSTKGGVKEMRRGDVQIIFLTGRLLVLNRDIAMI